MLSQLICFLKNLLWLLFNLISRWFKSEDKVLTQNLDVLIVGAGISGIAVAKVIIWTQCKALHITPLLPTAEAARCRGAELPHTGGRGRGGRHLALEPVPGRGLRCPRPRLLLLLATQPLLVKLLPGGAGDTGGRARSMMKIVKSCFTVPGECELVGAFNKEKALLGAF